MEMRETPLHPELPRSLAAVPDEKFPSRVTEQPSGRVFGLDVLRAVAILSVLLAHGSSVLIPHLPWWFAFIGHGGFYGVELFFVLSGFLIGTILVRAGDKLREPSQIVTFYIRRWFRTLPLFWIFLGIHVWLEASLRDHRPNALEIAQHGFFLRNLFGLHITFFPESWSLAVEEWFYLLFPLALWCGLRLVRRFDVVFLTVALGFFLFSNTGRMLTASRDYATWTAWMREGVFFRFDGLMLGVFAAWLALRYDINWRKYRALCGGAGILLLAAMYATLWTVSGHDIGLSADDYFARTIRFTLVSLGFALLLPAASTWKLGAENIFSTMIRRIALWSYALYLVHLPLIQIVQRQLSPTPTSSLPYAIGVFALEIGGSLLISALLYRVVESRCTHLRDAAAPAAGRFVAKRLG